MTLPITQATEQVFHSVCGYRRKSQHGSMSAILQTQASFNVVYYHPTAGNLAIQITRNLFQYFGADAEVFESKRLSSTAKHGSYQKGNIISIGIGHNVSTSPCEEFPIRLSTDHLTIQDEVGFNHVYYSGPNGLAVIFLRPLNNGRLELVIWGVDYDSVAVATRFVPMLTGVGQPDFLVLTRESKLKGLEDVLAVGFFDSRWSVSKTAIFM